MRSSGSGWSRGAHVFIDESKQRSYLLVASVIVPNDLQRVRKAVRALRHPESRTIHMEKESNESRRRIIRELSGLGLQAHVVESRGCPSELEVRFACLTQVSDGCERSRSASLTIELDESLHHHEKQLLLTSTRGPNLPDESHYEWKRPYEEPLLWVSDVAAWAYAKGGDWRKRVVNGGLIASVTSL